MLHILKDGPVYFQQYTVCYLLLTNCYEEKAMKI